MSATQAETSVQRMVEACPTELSPVHLARFERDGCLAFDGFLPDAEVAALRSAMTEMLRDLVAQARAGRAEAAHGNWDGMRNYSGLKIEAAPSKHGLLFEPDATFDLATASEADLEANVRKFSFPSQAHPAFTRLSQHPRLVAMLDALIGPGSILFGDMALCKPPFIGSEKPWHQDGAYFNYAPYGAGVDAWIALDDARVDNGCMFVIPGGHKLGPKKHVHRNDCEIEDGRLDLGRAAPVELRAGGILLFSVMLPHYTPPNRSPLRRRAVQLFYRAAHTRLVTTEEHAAEFLEFDGTPAACSATKG